MNNTINELQRTNINQNKAWMFYEIIERIDMYQNELKPIKYKAIVVKDKQVVEITV